MSDTSQSHIAIAGLRITAGVFFSPHSLGKALPPHGPVNFFEAAGYPVPWITMAAAGLVESAVALCLIAGFYVREAALIGAAVLAIAAASVIKVGNDGLWLWNFGGVEYLIFWALLCVFVAMLHNPQSRTATAS